MHFDHFLVYFPACLQKPTGSATAEDAEVPLKPPQTSFSILKSLEGVHRGIPQREVAEAQEEDAWQTEKAELLERLQHLQSRQGRRDFASGRDDLEVDTRLIPLFFLEPFYHVLTMFEQ